MDEQETDSMRAMLPPMQSSPDASLPRADTAGPSVDATASDFLRRSSSAWSDFWRRPSSTFGLSRMSSTFSRMSSATFSRPGSSFLVRLHCTRCACALRVRACRRDQTTPNSGRGVRPE